MRPGVVQSGFTLVELVGVMVIVGLLAVVALPRLGGENAVRESAFRDQALAALRHAQKTAVSRRRLVCASVTVSSVTLSIAAANPASSCQVPLPGPDGHAAFASGAGNAVSAGTGQIHFQPSGVATDASGSVASFNITVAGTPDIVVTGATGHVR